MKFVEVFRIYNLKFLKKYKLNLFLTIISIFLCMTVCLVTPVIAFYYQKNIDKNITEINGGDLCIFTSGKDKGELKNKLNDEENEGMKVETTYASSAAYLLDSKQIASRVVFGNYPNLADDEIILSESLAKSLNLSKSDIVSMKVQGETKDYKIKDIEFIAKGVDSDTEALGYGRVNLSEDMDTSKMQNIIHVTGKDGEELKDEFQEIEISGKYVTADEKKSALEENNILEVTVLNVLGSTALTLSLLSIAVFVFMNILKRKKDIGILKLISVKNSDIEKAMFLEMTLSFLVPLIAAGIMSCPLAKAFLTYKGIDGSIFDINGILIIIKGMCISILTAWFCIFISLRLCNKIKPFDILKNDEGEMIKTVRKSLLKFLVLLPVVIVVYGAINKDKSFILSSLVINVLVVLFLILVFILIKITGSINYHNKVLLYTFKSFKKNSIVFIFTVLSMTITITFVLMGYYMQDTIENNINKNVVDALPYNYEIIPDNEDFNDYKLTSSEEIDGYDKTYGLNGVMLNETKNNIYKQICIEEINEEDYNAKFNISEGENLFEEGDGEVIISDEMYQRCGFNIGDTLNIKYDDEVLNYKIKGAYKCSGINGITIYKENKEKSNTSKCTYLVKAEDSRFLSGIDNCMVWCLNDMGARFTASFDKFLKVFKILSIIAVISIVIVNINITNMAESFDAKNNEILIALGMGKEFVLKSRIIKVITNSFFASILSIGVFTFLIRFGIEVLFKTPGSIKISTVLVLSLLSLVFSLLSYVFNLKVNNTSFDLIREE